MLKAEELAEEVLEFFYVFSRFEFTLKECKMIVKPTRTINAFPDWDTFIKRYKNKYEVDDEIADSIDYLVNNPPNRQIVEADPDSEGKLSCNWKKIVVDDNAPLLKKLVDIVKVVRNNLFHGGKYGNKGWDDKARVKLLLTHSIKVVKSFSEIDDELEYYFKNIA